MVYLYLPPFLRSALLSCECNLIWSDTWRWSGSGKGPVWDGSLSILLVLVLCGHTSFTWRGCLVGVHRWIPSPSYLVSCHTNGGLELKCICFFPPLLLFFESAGVLFIFKSFHLCSPGSLEECMEAAIGALQLLYLAKSESIIFILHYNRLELLKYDFVMVWCNKVLIIDLQNAAIFCFEIW